MNPATFSPYGASEGLKVKLGLEGRFSVFNYRGLDWLKTTEAEWNAFSWVPSEWSHIPNTMPKPTFAEMVEYERIGDLASLSKYTRPFYDKSTQDSLRADALQKIDTPVDGHNLHTGKGLGHMGGLLQMAEQATISGHAIPHIRMQKSAGGTHRIHKQDSVRDLLKAAARNENVVESAHNIVMGRHRAETAKWQDSTLPYADREIAAKAAKQILVDYKSLLEAEIASFDPDALPEELDELKDVLIERFEAAALERIKYLRGVSTQQGVDLPATCPDAATAESSVASFRYKGSLLLRRATSAEAAQNTYKLYLSNIEKVKVANSPHFTLRNGHQKLGASHSFGRPDNEITLSLHQSPTLAEDTLQVEVTHSTGASYRVIEINPHRLDFTLTGASGAESVFSIIGRNLCGPTELHVTLN